METTHQSPVRTAAYEVTIRFDLDYVDTCDGSGCGNDSSEFTDTVVVDARVHDDEEDTLTEAEYEALKQIKADRDLGKNSPFYAEGEHRIATHYTHEVLSIKKYAA
jgi:hypothetical protein